MNIIKYFMIVIIGGLEISEVLLIMCGIFQFRFVKIKNYYLITGLIFIFSYFIIFYTENTESIPFFMPFMQIIIIFILLKENNFKKLLAFFAAFLSYSLLEEAVKSILSFLLHINYSHFGSIIENKLMIRSVTTFIIILMIHWIRKFYIKEYKSKVSSKVFVIFCIFALLRNCLIFYFGRLNRGNYKTEQPLIGEMVG